MRVTTASLAPVFDRLYSEKHRRMLERCTVAAGVVGFVVHLVHIFLARSLLNPPAIIAAAGTNYLAAIATPFSFILFYEVLTLISAVPESTTKSIAKQFEIVSLIFIRGFFSDIANLDPGNLLAKTPALAQVFLEVAAGLSMFLLVTIFQHAASKKSQSAGNEGAAALKEFIARKKLLALALTVIFISLAAVSVGRYALHVYGEVRRGSLVALAPPTTFYSDVFTVMIFTDVLILILSLLVSDRYELVFRNAAFVIATVLIRFSLTAAHPYGALLGVIGMLFGIATILIYNYNVRVTMLTEGKPWH